MTSGGSDETETLLNNRARLIDGMLLDICRAQNINSIPVLTAAMSILGEFNHIPREYHDALALYHRGAALEVPSPPRAGPVAVAVRGPLPLPLLLLRSLLPPHAPPCAHHSRPMGPISASSFRPFRLARASPSVSEVLARRRWLKTGS